MYSEIISDHDKLVADYDRLQKFGFDNTNIQELDGIHVTTVYGEIEIDVDDYWIVVYAFPNGIRKEIGRYTAFEADGTNKKLIRMLTNVSDAVSEWGERSR